MATLNGILKVTPATLTNYANTFNNSASQVQKQTNQMLSTVDTLCSRWKGDASIAYRRKFNTLRDDMQRMFKMIQEHSTDLQQMAKNYEQAEANNVGNINTLREDVIV